MGIVWKPIESYGGHYEISNCGEVKSFKKTKERTLKPAISGGYKVVSLSKNDKQKTWKVALLVWDAFGVGQRDGHSVQVDHIDENKLNDKIGNLQLSDSHRNIGDHYQRIGRKFPTGVRRVGNKFKAEIQINKKYLSLGYHDTVGKASLVYQSALRGGTSSQII